jgi:eukaryotic-like serine/threonine-protein kinase
MSAVMVGGRYRLDAPIGRGGMASVWRAIDTKLDRAVAVKRLHARLQDDPELEERFRREAQVVARLDHPHLVRLLDGGEEEDGSPYLVFELVEGEDLKEIVRTRGPLPPSQAARLCAQVARALAYAHQRGVVHRDIKSRNVLVTRDGDAKLTDFGIARLMAAEPGTGLTTTGMMVGTSDYLAPEQAHGGPVDARADVYSLGVVLYECLTGRLPFQGDTFVAVAMQHVQEPMPDPRAVSPDVPPRLATAVLRSGQKDPERRFQRAEDLALVLEGAASADGGTAIMPALPGPHDDDTARVRRRRRRWPWLAAAGVVLAAAAAGAALWAGGVIGGGGSGSSGSGPTRSLALAAVRDYDPPPGDGSENQDLVPNAYDANPDSAWYTERYQTADFGGLKPGVGLVIRLRRSARASELDVTSPTPGVGFSVLGGGQGTDRPVYARGTLTGGRQRIRLSVSAPSDVYVLWLTRLVPSDTPDRYWAGVGEVSLRGPANP